MLTELLLTTTLITQNVGPGYVGRPAPEYPYYICLNDPTSDVNMRSRPTTKSKKIGALRQGNPVDIISRGAGPDDGMWWAYVRTHNGGTGYVRDDYVCVR